MSIRSRIRRDNDIILGREKGFGIEIELISPDGVVYTEVFCRLVYSDVSLNLDNVEIITNDPVVSIPFGQLDRIPKKGEKWVIKIPETISSSTLISCTYERPPERNDSMGYITLRLIRIEQS